MQLPTEVRLIVLRYLHRSLLPIEPISTACDMVSANPDQLSSQVLRVCQTLYAEAYNILYGENTVSICYGPPCLEILNATITLDGRAGTAKSFSKQDLLNILKHRIHVPHGISEQQQERKLMELYPIIARFRNIRIVPRTTVQNEPSKLCRLVHDILLDQDTFLGFVSLCTGEGCEVCWSEGYPTTQCQNAATEENQQTESMLDIFRTITKLGPVLDMADTCRYMWHSVVKQLPKSDDSEYLDLLRSVHAMEQAVVDLNICAFHHWKVRALKLASIWNHNAAKEDIRNLEIDYEEEERELEDQFDADMDFLKTGPWSERQESELIVEYEKAGRSLKQQFRARWNEVRRREIVTQQTIAAGKRFQASSTL